MTDHRYQHASQLLNELCRDFYALSETNFFGYRRFYQDRSYEFIFSDSVLQTEYLQKKGFITQFEARHFNDFVSGFIYEKSACFWDELSHVDAKNSLSDFLTWQDKQNDFCDFFSFGGPRGSLQVTTLFTQQLPFIKKFCQLALPHCRDIIAHCGLDKFTIPQQNNLSDVEISLLSVEKSLQCLLGLVQTYQAKNKRLAAVQLSQRELECLTLLLQNKTAKEVARILHLSQRTVEHHYDRLKLKLGLPSKAALKQLFSF